MTVTPDVGALLGYGQYRRELDKIAHIRCDNCAHFGALSDGAEIHSCNHPKKQGARIYAHASCGLFAHKDDAFVSGETAANSGNSTDEKSGWEATE